MKYIKTFDLASEYEVYMSGEPVLPNVSYVVDSNVVRYNPKKAFTLRAQYNATADNLVAFTDVQNLKSLKVNGSSIEFEPIKNETTTFDVLGENISIIDVETYVATFPDSYLIKSPVSSWTFKAKDPNYTINENTYVCMLGMMDGKTLAQPMLIANVMGDTFTTNDGVTLEVADTFLAQINTQIQSGLQAGFALCEMDTDSGTFVFIDTEHQTNVTTGGLSTYSFDSEGLYDVEIELADPDMKDIRFYETPLISIEIGSGITTIGNSAFSYCSGLTEVTIGSGVTSIGNSAFSGCSGLTGELVIPDSVTEIGNFAFSGCKGLTEVTIGSGVTSIGESAFQNCYGLTSITIPDSVTTIEGLTFYNCLGLKSITLGLGITYIDNTAFANTLYSNLNEITCLATTAPSIHSGAFAGVKENGVLKVPAGSDYSSWMSTDENYLGYYNWTIQTI